VNLSHIADITRRARVSPAMNSSPFRDVQSKSRPRLSDLCHMRYARQVREKSRCSTRGAACVACLRIGARSPQTTSALNEKKEAGFPAPLAMTTEVHFVFFLVTAITFAPPIAHSLALQSRRP